MSTLSTVSIPLILIGESSKRPVVFIIELSREQPLSPAFMNPDIIAGLVYEHTTVEPLVVQILDEKNFVFMQGKDIENYVIHCNPSGCVAV